MTVISRIVLRLATAAAVAFAISQSAFALDYPTKPVRLIVGVAPIVHVCSRRWLHHRKNARKAES
jgi:hypothetical protein